ncbi:MAG TPA: hypothetical protein VGM67_16510 [Gemmatimonadaceae bacterium]
MRWVGAVMLMAASAVVARAQTPVEAYRVVLSSPGSSTITVADFRPCVVGDKARCGAWVERDVDTSLDPSFGKPPGLVDRGRSANGGYGVSFAAVAVRVTPLITADSGSHIDVKVPSHTPRALAMSPDSRYAFVVFQSLDGQPPQVCMIDLSAHKVVATLDTKKAISGVGMVPDGLKTP